MTSNTQRRVKFCLVAAILDFLVLALPKLEGAAFYSLAPLGVLLNAIAIWLILRGVKPLMDESEHLMTVAFSKRWIAALGGLLSIIALAASFSGEVEKQAIPFLVLGYIFLLLVPMKIMDLAVKKRLREMGNGS